MKIAVDGMGGDHAPGEIVKGAILAAREHGVDIALVGPEDRMRAELAKHDHKGVNIEVVHAPEYLVEGEHPAFALRQKRNASIIIATKLVRDHKADAVVSAGPTGGVVAAALYLLGTIEGMSRPVLGGTFLGFAPNTIVMDLGGNVDCQPHHFLDFAVVGTVYAREILNIPNPTVALLSVGAEEGKGNTAVNESVPLLKQSGLNFIGNVEGHDIPMGKANVIVCDGFVGNILLKYTEALGKTIGNWLTGKIDGKLSADEAGKLVRELVMATNVAETAGGGPLWAVNGISVIVHGRADAHELSNAIGQAKFAVERDLVGLLKKELASARGKAQGSP